MFRSILRHVTGMVSMVRQRFQNSSGPSKGKKTATIATKSTKKPTKRKKSPVRAVKKA
jgi:hypothetical protein